MFSSMTSHHPEPASAETTTPPRGKRPLVWALVAIAAVLVVALVVALVLWAPWAASDPEPTATPTATPTETETPEPEPRDVPQSRVRVTCDELVSPDAAAAVLGAPVAANGTTPVDSGEDAVYRQAGMQSCVWETGELYLSVELMIGPNYWSYDESELQQFEVDGYPAWESCWEWDGAAGCNLYLRIGEAFVATNLYVPASIQPQAPLRGLAPGVAQAVAAAPVEDAWTPPATSLDANSVHDLDARVIGDAFGIPGLGWWGGEFGGLLGSAMAAVQGAGPRMGVHDGDGFMQLALLPGGAWAIDELMESGYTSTEVDGVDAAVVKPFSAHGRGGIPDSNGTTVCVDLDGSLVCAISSQTDAAQAASGMATLAALLRG